MSPLAFRISPFLFVYLQYPISFSRCYCCYRPILVRFPVKMQSTQITLQNRFVYHGKVDLPSLRQTHIQWTWRTFSDCVSEREHQLYQVSASIYNLATLFPLTLFENSKILKYFWTYNTLKNTKETVSQKLLCFNIFIYEKKMVTLISSKFEYISCKSEKGWNILETMFTRYSVYKTRKDKQHVVGRRAKNE